MLELHDKVLFSEHTVCESTAGQSRQHCRPSFFIHTILVSFGVTYLIKKVNLLNNITHILKCILFLETNIS